MPKIVLIGAGSMVFARNLIGDILTFPSLSEGTLALVDTDEHKLGIITALAKRMVAQQKTNTRIESSSDRRQVLEGADYVIMSIRVGDVEGVVKCHQIPLKYGVDHSVADTTGPGGIFYFLLNGPAILDVLKDVERMAPRAWVIQYTNPMVMNCWLANMATKAHNVGLCHSVQGTAFRLADYIGAPRDDVRYWVAGINHMAWFLRFEWQGKDAYPLLWEAMAKPDIYARDPVRFEIMRYFGAFVTESSRHMSEYVPYFRRTPELLQRYAPPSASEMGNGEQWAERRRVRLEEIRQLAQGDGPIPLERTHEYCTYIIDAIERNQPFSFNGNVRNTGLIMNLPHDCVVEVPCLAQGTGVHPCYVGDLPAELTALNRSNLGVQELAVQGLLNHDREAIYRAVQLDPLTAATVTLPNMRKMVDELFAALAPLLTF
jgi:alpha-galactosidase